MAVDFYKKEGSYYRADNNAKILNLDELQSFAKAGGKEKAYQAPAPTQDRTYFDNASSNVSVAPINPTVIKASDLGKPPETSLASYAKTAEVDNTNYLNTLTTKFSSDQETVDAKKNDLSTFYQNQQKQYEAQIKQYQDQINTLTGRQEGALEDVKAITQPWQEKLETAEKQRLLVDDNYFANQKAITELDTLLKEANAQINAASTRPGITGISRIRQNQVVNNYNGRVSMIKSVMEARTGQIAQAYEMIDRSVDSIKADKQGQLAYYENLLNFLGAEKQTANIRLTDSQDEMRKAIAEQTEILKADIEQAEERANYIKNLMIDQESAQFMHDAGVKLDDPIEVVNKKMADQSYQLEVKDLKADLQSRGYEYIPSVAGLKGLTEDQIFRTTDSRGRELIFKKPVEETAQTMASGSRVSGGSGRSSGGGNVQTSTFKFTNDELNTARAYGAGDFSDETKNVFMNNLNKAQRDEWKSAYENYKKTLTGPAESAENYFIDWYNGKVALSVADETMQEALKAEAGGDGKVSPDTWNRLKKEWVDAGLPLKDFNSKFSGFKNPNNPYYDSTAAEIEKLTVEKAEAKKTANREIDKANLKENKENGYTREEAKKDGYAQDLIDEVFGAKKPWYKFW